MLYDRKTIHSKNLVIQEEISAFHTFFSIKPQQRKFFSALDGMKDAVYKIYTLCLKIFYYYYIYI